MSTHFSRKDRDQIEFMKTLAAVIFMFLAAVTGIAWFLALSDWHNHLWFWGIH